MQVLPSVVCLAVGFFVSLAAVPLVIHLAGRLGLAKGRHDLHHTHTVPIPRFGGLALALAFVFVELIAVFAYPDTHLTKEHLVFVVACLAMFLLGFRDDLKPLGAKWKLVGQVIIASGVYGLGLGVVAIKIPFTSQIVELYSLGYLFTVLWLVGMTNLINLIDGVDGVAGGICLMLMVLLAFVGGQAGGHSLVALGMAGALLGFLRFNFPPAKIYLGDGGAYFLGFQVGMMSLLSSNKGTVIVALVAPLFVLALPILDTALAITRRGLRGLPIFRADNRHLHHHMLGSGMSRRKVVLTFYGVTVLFLVMAFVAFVSRGQSVPALLGVGAAVLLVCAGKFDFSREWFAVGRVVGNSLAMRKEIQYALSHARWLELEGKRATSVDTLWAGLVFAAEKIGFSRVTLTLGGTEREWARGETNERGPEHLREFPLGMYGTLRVHAPGHGPGEEGLARRNGGGGSVSIRDARLFEILSELFAEAWVKAAKKYAAQRRGSDVFKPVGEPVEAGGRKAGLPRPEILGRT